MQIKKLLVIGFIFLFIGVAVAPSINFNTVKASHQSVIKERINQRELLFQTIIDIANNKEIQRIILKSQMNRGIFPTSEFPALTKSQLKGMYVIGLLLSKFIDKSKIQSMAQQYQLSNSGTQQEISAVINKDATLNEKITQLSALNCDCNNDNYKEKGIPDNICGILFYIFLTVLAPSYILSVIFHNTPLLWFIVAILIELPSFLVAICIIFLMGFVFNCWGSIPTQ
jgi:hypothetical protein